MRHSKWKSSLWMFLLLSMANTAIASSWLDAFSSTMKPRTYIPTISVDLHDLIERNSARYGIPPAFSAVVVYLESSYDSCAVSPMNAQGIMQLMPKTAADLRVIDPYDPVQGIQGGIAYLAEAYQRTNGDLSLSAAYYNAGPKALRLRANRWPIETQNHIRRLVRVWPKFEGERWRQQVPKTIMRTNRLLCSYTVSR